MSIFDEVIDRHHTESFKWDYFNDPETLIPLPVADMDFRCPEPVLSALDEVTHHGIMGYSIIPDELSAVFVKRVFEKYGWKIEKEWLVWIPGLIPAITSLCQMIGMPGDEVLTTVPAYYPIHLAPKRVGKELISIPMLSNGERWVIDYAVLENVITPKSKLFILCNPYNPGGTVFTRAELEKLLAICQAKGMIICSDEIHCDLILDQSKQHIPIGSISPVAEQMTITLMAPSKTFNIAGLGCSVAIIPNDKLRAGFEEVKAGLFPFLSRYSIKAALSAYIKCESWRCELIDYLKGNHDYLYREINTIAGLSMYPMEATYLAWIKYEIPGFCEKLLANGVRVNDGKIYLREGYFRLNFACPRTVLKTAVERIRATAEG